MEYTINQREAGWMEVEYQFSPASLQRFHHRLIQHYQQRQLPLPTFDVLQQQVHEYAAKQAIKHICQQEHKTPWEEPEWEILDSTQGLSLAISLEVLPEVQLGDYRQLAAEVPPVPIPDEATLMTRLVDQQYALAELEPVERPIALGDRVVLDLVTLHGGKPVPLGSKARLEVMVYPEAFAPGFSEALVGLKAGDRKQISSIMSPHFQLDAYREQAVHYEVYIHQVFEQHLPPLALLPELMGVESLDVLTEQLYEEQRTENQETWLKLIRRHLLLQVAACSTFTLPETLLEAEMISRWEQQEEAELQGQGLSETLQDEALERWLAEPSLQDEIYQDLACQLVARAIAHAENLDVSAADLLLTLKPFADRFDVAPEVLVTEMQSNGQLGPYSDRLVTEMVLDLLYERATLTCEGEVIKAPEPESSEHLTAIT